ncbi:Disulphide bond corrector protein DsbC [Pedobacter nyackensis]|uniref:Disulphide bond corrector protein DsbC n=2 Tax=Pedobacter nyackensis TaxID=475255 RepID=A0A1W2AL11_9SPHI|nr:Disulphide bond corrector protein DsbC [Pedobacter nyackensis]
MMLLIIALTVYKASGQQPVLWTASAKPLKDNTFEIRLIASISDGWYIYSQFMGNKGPLPTSITYKKNPSVDILGKVEEIGELKQKYESSFGIDVKYYYNKVEFIQQVKLNGKLPVTLNGSVAYMGCNAQMCMPPQVEDFKVVLR